MRIAPFDYVPPIDIRLFRQATEGQGLNESQLRAVQAVADGFLTIIQGPPGTGKTTTAVTILRMLALACPNGFTTLATAGSHSAIGNLLSGCTAHDDFVLHDDAPATFAGKGVCRLGNEAHCSESWWL